VLACPAANNRGVAWLLRTAKRTAQSSAPAGPYEEPRLPCGALLDDAVTGWSGIRTLTATRDRQIDSLLRRSAEPCHGPPERTISRGPTKQVVLYDPTTSRGIGLIV